MAAWNRVINLAEKVQAWKNGEIGYSTIAELADKVADQIERSGWLDDTPYPDTLRDHLNGLKQATTTGEYQAAFEYIYDTADDDCVWIETS